MRVFNIHFSLTLRRPGGRRSPGAGAVAKLVAEVVLPAAGGARAAFTQRLDAGAVALCLAPVGSDAETCFPSSMFNEFSTVDVNVPWGGRLEVALWLADAQQVINGSETFLSFDVDGVYGGNGISTVRDRAETFAEGQASVPLRFEAVWHALDDASSTRVEERPKEFASSKQEQNRW